jgi:hypothetical protein
MTRVKKIPSNKLNEFQTHFSKCLQHFFKFTEIYAKWFSENVRYLQSGSIELLKTLGPDDLDLMRYSAVTSLSSEGDFVAFKLAVRGITKGFSIPK